jgi:hypothetical protein
MFKALISALSDARRAETAILGAKSRAEAVQLARDAMFASA